MSITAKAYSNPCCTFLEPRNDGNAVGLGDLFRRDSVP